MADEFDADEIPSRIAWHRKRPSPPPRWLRVLRRELEYENE